MDEYRLFGVMNYKVSGGLWQIIIIVDGRFGYIGVNDEQRKELLELKKQQYSKPIEELLPNSDPKTYLQDRDKRIKILEENHINDIWIQWDGKKVVGYTLKPVMIV